MTLGKTQIMNHVILAAGVPARMHFTASRLEPWDIHDSYTGELKTITRLVLHCDMVDGLPVNADYSVAGDKHRLDFQPYIDNGQLTQFDFTVSKTGAGRATQYLVRVDRRV